MKLKSLIITGLTAVLFMGCGLIQKAQAYLDAPDIITPTYYIKGELGDCIADTTDNDVKVTFYLTSTTGIELYELTNFGSNTIAKTKAYDNFGNEYDMIITFGDDTGNFHVAARNPLPKGEKVKVTLNVEDVNPSATSFSRIIVSAWEVVTLPTGEPSQITLYNIAITR